MTTSRLRADGPGAAERGTGILHSLARAHDAVTTLGFDLAKLCLVVIVASYVYETVARYFFAAPTAWSGEIVSYALCIGVFLALPELTRRKGHIAITFLLEALPPAAARVLAGAIALVSGLVCLLVAWISLQENIRQFMGDVQLVKVYPFGKVWISSWITFGFLSAGIYFLRSLGGGPSARASSDDDVRM